MKSTHRIRSPRARRAFTLWEMLLTVLVVSIAMNVGMRLIHATVRTYAQTADASRSLKAQRQWLDQLRRDAWSCESRTISDGKLTFGGRSAVVWHQEPRRLIRSADGESRSWEIETKSLRWSVTNAGVLELGDDDVTVALASPAAAGKAGEP